MTVGTVTTLTRAAVQKSSRLDCFVQILIVHVCRVQCSVQTSWLKEATADLGWYYAAHNNSYVYDSNTKLRFRNRSNAAAARYSAVGGNNALINVWENQSQKFYETNFPFDGFRAVSCPSFIVVLCCCFCFVWQSRITEPWALLERLKQAANKLNEAETKISSLHGHVLHRIRQTTLEPGSANYNRELKRRNASCSILSTPG